MTPEQMRLLVDNAVTNGYLFESEGMMLSTAEGFNRSSLAVLGAMILNLGRPTFNAYCDYQLRILGWLKSRANPITRRARELRSMYKANDPTARSMFEDVAREFVRPLVIEHVARGGQRLSASQEGGTCAMLLAKILWDLELGGSELAAAIRMLKQGPRD